MATGDAYGRPFTRGASLACLEGILNSFTREMLYHMNLRQGILEGRDRGEDVEHAHERVAYHTEKVDTAVEAANVIIRLRGFVATTLRDEAAAF